MMLNNKMIALPTIIGVGMLGACLGCETAAKSAASRPPVSSDTRSLKTATPSGFTEEVVPGPKLVLGVHWENIGRESPVASDEIRLVVENYSDIDLVVSAGVIATGLLTYEETLKLGERTLAPAESMVFPVRAADLPVQVAVGVGQLFADVRTMVPKKTGMMEWRAPVQAVYFQHKDDFRAMETFVDTEILTNEKGGHLGGLPANAPMDGRVLGRVRNADGAFETVRADHSGLAARNADGVVTGYLTGMEIEISIGDVPPGLREEVE